MRGLKLAHAVSQWSESSWVYVMACHWYGAKSLPEPMFNLLETRENYLWTLNPNINIFCQEMDLKMLSAKCCWHSSILNMLVITLVRFHEIWHSPATGIKSIRHYNGYWHSTTTVQPTEYAHGFIFIYFVVVVTLFLEELYMLLPYSSMLLHWHWSNLTIASVLVK